MSLNQFESGMTRTLVVSVEKMIRDNRPRSDTLTGVEGPNVVTHGTHDQIWPFGIGLERVTINETGDLARPDVDLSFVTDDQVNVVLTQRGSRRCARLRPHRRFDRAPTGAHTSRFARSTIEAGRSDQQGRSRLAACEHEISRLVKAQGFLPRRVPTQPMPTAYSTGDQLQCDGTARCRHG